MEEVWKEIKGFPKYQISNMGNIRSFSDKKKGKTLKPQINKKGYYSILLYSDGKPHPKKVHRLVAEAFIPNLEHKEQINHINGIKTDNRIENLEWCTNSENQIHAYKNGLEKPRCKRKVKQYSLNNEYIKTYEYIKDAKKELGINEASISLVCKGKRKTAGGYIWKYAPDNN